MKRWLLILAILAAASTIKAQTVQTIPQTVDTTLANGLACTGTTQNFDTGVAVDAVTGKPFSNLGQTQHFATIQSTLATQLSMEIDGLDSFGNVTRLSDVLALPSSLGTGTLKATGRFARIRVSVLCLPASTATFQLTYAGTSSSPVDTVGTYLLSSIDKAVFNGSSANNNQGASFQTPFGSSQGTISFEYVTSAITGSTLGVGCATALGVGQQVFSFPLTNVLISQTFQVPAVPCTSVVVQYNSGGIATGTIRAEYIFSPNGAPSLVDPCATPAVMKQNVAINAAATTQLFTGSATQSIFVCGFSFTIAGSATATAQLEYGTGATCGTGTTVQTGAYLGGVVPVLIVSPSIPGTVFKIPAGNNLCIAPAGATPSVQGQLTFVSSTNIGI